jgi:hypothetical protein
MLVLFGFACGITGAGLLMALAINLSGSSGAGRR